MAISADRLEDKRKGYQWSADRLTEAEMAVLYQLRCETGIPINELLSRAVRELRENLQTEVKRVPVKNKKC